MDYDVKLVGKLRPQYTALQSWQAQNDIPEEKPTESGPAVSPKGLSTSEEWTR